MSMQSPWHPDSATSGGGLPNDFDGRITSETRFETRAVPRRNRETGETEQREVIELHVKIDAPTVQENKDFNIGVYPDGTTGHRYYVADASNWEVLDGGVCVRHRTVERASFWKEADVVWLVEQALKSGFPEEKLPGYTPDGAFSCEFLWDAEFHWSRINPKNYAEIWAGMKERGSHTRTYKNKEGEEITVDKDLKRLMPVKYLDGAASAAPMDIEGDVEQLIAGALAARGGSVMVQSLAELTRQGIAGNPRLAAVAATIPAGFFNNPPWLGNAARPWTSDGSALTIK